MELLKSFDPQEIESHWYPLWESRGYFKPNYDAEGPAYCIQLPPPNVTGTLHMGHAFQHTIMDILIRYHRMLGENVLWQPGTDHAGIATQIVVERQLDAQGISRHDLGREAFIEKIWEWKETSGSTITQQMRRMGASCDWSRERFTMDPKLSNTVREVFIKLYQNGFIYRGKRLVNWDPVLGTAVSDLEVISEEENGSLWYIRYPLSKGEGEIVIATTRPETMLGDMAVAVHPEDERYRHLIGQKLTLPLVGREIPIIADDYVDPSFGTGCVKITPAHDFNDYQIGQRHGLAPISILTLDAHINEKAPAAYQGMERFAARKQIVTDLEKEGFLVEVKPHKLMVPRGDRTGVVIEPMLTDQWFVQMEQFAKDALAYVEQGEIRFVPENWKNTYDQWLNNIQDWCISRQLWWGHRIPAWYDESGKIYVAATKEEAIKEAGHDQLSQDEDVLDTWFSSALWCFSTLDWPENSRELDTFLPSNVLVTGFDIIFFWVARMIMFTKPFTQKQPFQDVYVTGLVRDSQGQKMSKSKGNIIDPIDLIDGISLEALVEKRTKNLMNPKHAQQITKQTQQDYPEGFPAFGTDALRFTFASLATHGRDVRFDIKRIEGNRNFCNKLWNATRFVLMNINEAVEIDSPSTEQYSFADLWIISRLQEVIESVTTAFHSYRFDLAARAIYEFVWDEYCDWYVELAKVTLQSPNQYQQKATRYTLLHVLETILRVAHPIMPFITESLWQSIAPLIGRQGDSIMIAGYPQADKDQFNACAIQQMQTLQSLITAIRNLRGEMRLSPAQKVPLYIEADDQLAIYLPYIQLLAKLSEVHLVEKLPTDDAPVAVSGNTRLMLHVEIDKTTEISRLQKELDKLIQEIQKAEGKLNNPHFVDKAPSHVIAQEKARLAQFTASKEKIDAQLQKLR